MTNVYLCIAPLTAPLPAARFDYWCAQLPPKNRERVMRFKRWQDAHATLYGRLLLQMAAAHYELTLEDVEYTEYGKPYFKDGFDFSIAHSGEHVICVFSKDCRVGADIEKIKDVDLNDFGSIFHPQELHFMQNASYTSLSFFHSWTRKEAVMKADGCGLNYDLNLIDTSVDLVSLKGVDWHLQTIRLDDNHVMSVCADLGNFHIHVEHKIIE